MLLLFGCPKAEGANQDIDSADRLRIWAEELPEDSARAEQSHLGDSWGKWECRRAPTAAKYDIIFSVQGLLYGPRGGTV